ncbi:unnamed protein product [Trichobilharzia szidati]|nr:unnamed protein product [Trichobilharzia szidati]CAH8875737.1 unnamed protein product [Trichobilharzia szidati]
MVVCATENSFVQNQMSTTNQLSNPVKRGSYSAYSKGQTQSPGQSQQQHHQSQQQQQQQQVWPSSLPPGWKREECMRPNGLCTGKSYVYYISPQNQIVRNKQEMQTILGDSYDIGLFDWRLGKFTLNRRTKQSEEQATDASSAKAPRVDNQPLLSKRRCPYPIHEIQPVMVRSYPECKRIDGENENLESPRQLFWERRLAGIAAVDSETGEPFKPISLPRGIQSAGAPGYQSTQLLQSLVHALSNQNNPVIGQEQDPSDIENDPCATLNHSQPMIKTFIVTDDDIRRQEARVKELRRRLAMVRRKFDPRYEAERQG